MIRKKLAVTAAMAGVAALVLTGCGRSTDGGAGAEAAQLDDSPATGTITVWAQGTEGEALKDFVKPFEEANPDVDVEVTPIPWDSAQNKYQTAVAGNVTPDIGMLGTDWMSMFSSALAPVPEQIDLSGMFESSVDTATIDGTVYGVPWYADTRVVFYRTDLMKQAGISEFPTDWDGFKKLAEAYKQQAGAEYGVQLSGSGWNSFFSNLPFVWSNGGEVINDAQDEWEFTSPEVTDTLDYLNSFWAEGLADRNPNTDQGAGVAAFIDGSAPMFIGGPFNVNDIRTAAGEEFFDEFALAPIPAADGGTSTSIAGGCNLAVFDGAKNPDAAWKLIRWMSEPENQVEWYKTIKDLPTQRAAWQDAVFTEDPKAVVFGDQLESTTTPPTVTTWAQVSAAADTIIEQISRGEKTPEQGLTELQSTADSTGFGR